MSEPLRKKARFWRRTKKLYPNACACIGTKLGDFHGRTWWHAVGKVQAIFRLAELDILEKLRTEFTDSYSSIVHFQLYMIGHSEASAIPTIMFFSADKEPRKKAKKAIEEGDILSKLPGFRTGHQAKQPIVGPLIRPAKGKAPTQAPNSTGPTLDVYFDPLRPIQAIGMPVFVKHRGDAIRQATANAVFEGQACVFMSVSHVLFDHTAAPQDYSTDTDSEYDFGSGTESEGGECHVDVTSRASMSSREQETDSPAETSSSDPDSPIQVSDTTLVNPIQSDSRNKHTAKDKVSKQQRNIHIFTASSIPKIEHLKYLGHAKRTSIDMDGALISIVNSEVLSFVQNSMFNTQEHRHNGTNVHPPKGVTQVVARTSHGSIPGLLPNTWTYMQLPGSTTFQKVFEVTLDASLDWGDCGTVVLDARTAQPYGHVVVSSISKRIAFIMAAPQTFETLEIQWNIPVFYGSQIHPCEVVNQGTCFSHISLYLDD
jgi:hypothetical protein